jgi:hypothetical protein
MSTSDDDRSAVSGVPRLDALDPADPGAPAEAVGTGAGDGTGPGARYEGRAGGSGARVARLRDRGADANEPPAGVGGAAPDEAA